jgi:hypothetical protein
MSNIIKNHLRVLEVISSLSIEFNDTLRAGRKLRMSDKEEVALSLTAEFMSIDSENNLFKQLDISQIPNLIERNSSIKGGKDCLNFLKP